MKYWGPFKFPLAHAYLLSSVSGDKPSCQSADGLFFRNKDLPLKGWRCNPCNATSQYFFKINTKAGSIQSRQLLSHFGLGGGWRRTGLSMLISLWVPTVLFPMKKRVHQPLLLRILLQMIYSVLILGKVNLCSLPNNV